MVYGVKDILLMCRYMYMIYILYIYIYIYMYRRRRKRRDIYSTDDSFVLLLSVHLNFTCNLCIHITGGGRHAVEEEKKETSFQERDSCR